MVKGSGELLHKCLRHSDFADSVKTAKLTSGGYIMLFGVNVLSFFYKSALLEKQNLWRCCVQARLRRLWRQHWQPGETFQTVSDSDHVWCPVSFWPHHPRRVVWQMQWHPLWDQDRSFQHLRIIVRFLWGEDPSENDNMFARFMDDVFSKQVATPRPFPLTCYDFHPTVHFLCEEKQRCTLPFMDIKIIQPPDVMATAVYRKPTLSSLFVPFGIKQFNTVQDYQLRALLLGMENLFTGFLFSWVTGPPLPSSEQWVFILSCEWTMNTITSFRNAGNTTPLLGSNHSSRKCSTLTENTLTSWLNHGLSTCTETRKIAFEVLKLAGKSGREMQCLCIQFSTQMSKEQWQPNVSTDIPKRELFRILVYRVIKTSKPGVFLSTAVDKVLQPLWLKRFSSQCQICFQSSRGNLWCSCWFGRMKRWVCRTLWPDTRRQFSMAVLIAVMRMAVVFDGMIDKTDDWCRGRALFVVDLEEPLAAFLVKLLSHATAPG